MPNNGLQLIVAALPPLRVPLPEPQASNGLMRQGSYCRRPVRGRPSLVERRPLAWASISQPRGGGNAQCAGARGLGRGRGAVWFGSSRSGQSHTFPDRCILRPLRSGLGSDRKAPLVGTWFTGPRCSRANKDYARRRSPELASRLTAPGILSESPRWVGCGRRWRCVCAF